MLVGTLGSPPYEVDYARKESSFAIYIIAVYFERSFPACI